MCACSSFWLAAEAASLYSCHLVIPNLCILDIPLLVELLQGSPFHLMTIGANTLHS